MHTDVVLPLDKLTVDEKMEIVYTVWDDIFRHSNDIKWPAWHSAYLRKLKNSIDEGKEEVMDFEVAKEILLKETP